MLTLTKSAGRWAISVLTQLLELQKELSLEENPAKREAILKKLISLVEAEARAERPANAPQTVPPPAQIGRVFCIRVNGRSHQKGDQACLGCELNEPRLEPRWHVEWGVECAGLVHGEVVRDSATNTLRALYFCDGCGSSVGALPETREQQQRTHRVA